MNIENNVKKQSIIVFSISILFIVLFNIISFGNLYKESPDGNLYISIAENFIKTGHFIQTARPSEINMVVPFGLPLILTIGKILFGNMNGVLIFQYTLFGLLNVFLYLTCINLTKSKILGTLAVSIYCTSNAVLYKTASPAYILTEIYYLFSISLIMYILTIKEKTIDYKIKICLVIEIVVFFIRTLFIVWLIPLLILCIVRIFQKKIESYFLINIIVSIIVTFIINIGINYYATGEFILLQNYGGDSFYLANNSNTSTTSYSSNKIKHFASDDYFEVIENVEMTRGKKTEILSNRAKIWIRNNPMQFIKNTIIKFYNLFVKAYNIDFFIMIFVTIYMVIKNKSYEFLLFFVMFILMAIVTSIGLNVERYSYFALLFYIVYKITFIKEIYNLKKVLLLSESNLKKD